LGWKATWCPPGREQMQKRRAKSKKKFVKALGFYEKWWGRSKKRVSTIRGALAAHGSFISAYKKDRGKEKGGGIKKSLGPQRGQRIEIRE